MWGKVLRMAQKLVKLLTAIARLVQLVVQLF